MKKSWNFISAGWPLSVICTILVGVRKGINLMEKKSLFSTKTMVATALGAALFFVLFAYVKIPSPIPETNFQLAYGVSAFFGCLFGPVAGCLIAGFGHTLNDFIFYGSPWWSWVVASAISGLIAGLAFYYTKLEEGEFNKKTILTIIVINVIGNAVAWMLVAPCLDILIYAEPAKKVFLQGVTSFIADGVSSIVVCLLLAAAYSKTRTKTGSLDQE